MDIKSLEQGISRGDRTLLSRAITLCESSKPEHQKLANELLSKILPKTGKSIRLGVSGTPGVGKSTFIECFGKLAIEKGFKVAVLAVDPSSSVSGGSILGDKTRMSYLSSHDNAFVRPSPSSGKLGGLAIKTREAMLLCEAAGYDFVILETVGVGQSEITVSSMVDCFLLLLQAGAGDELQGIKRGILELADIVSINKADGSNIKAAKLAQSELKNALHILRSSTDNEPEVFICSALEETGIDAILSTIMDIGSDSDQTKIKRNKQLKSWFNDLIKDEVVNRYISQNSELEKIQEKLVDHKYTIFEALTNAMESIEKIK